MKKVGLVLLATALLSACSEEPTDSSISGSDIQVDDRTGCAYLMRKPQAGEPFTALYDSKGKQVGCRGIEDVTTVKEYLNMNGGE